MKIRFTLVLSATFSFSQFVVLSQTLPSTRYSDKEQIGYSRALTGMTFGYGYFISRLLTKPFYENLKSNDLTPLWGNAIIVGYQFNPIGVEWNLFSARFRPSEDARMLYNLTDSTRLVHRGGDLWLTCNILPLPEKLSKRMSLPVGIGYQLSEVAIVSGSALWKDAESSISTNTAMVRAGVRIHPRPHLFLQADARQSVSAAHRHFQLLIGAGYFLN